MSEPSNEPRGRDETASARPKRTSNRRQSIRQTARSNIKVECYDNGLGLGKDICEQFLDVSETGVRLIIRKSLEIKQESEILIHVEGQRKPIKRISNVVWIVPTEGELFCVGYEFQKRLRYQDVARIGRYR